MQSDIDSSVDMAELLSKIKVCTVCEGLPLGPKPILQTHADAKILIVGQAPGKITHLKGIPFDDPSGRRLRDWMGVSEATFYDPKKIAVLPMGFCFPGTGKSGDLPPRKECAVTWREALLERMPNVELTIIIGQYAMEWHLQVGKKDTLTNIVADWKSYFPHQLPLPHPSPRNNRWLKRNPWFEQDVLPALQGQIQNILA